MINNKISKELENFLNLYKLLLYSDNIEEISIELLKLNSLRKLNVSRNKMMSSGILERLKNSNVLVIE